MILTDIESIELVLNALLARGGGLQVGFAGWKSVPGELTLVTRDRLHFTIPDFPYEASPEIKLDRAYAFLGGHPLEFNLHALDQEWNEARRELTIQVRYPTEIKRNDPRSHARTMVSNTLYVSCELTTNNESYACTIGDASHSGARLSFGIMQKYPDAPTITGGLRVVTTAGEICEMACIIVWRRERNVGVLLPDMARHPDGDLSQPWLRLVRKGFLFELANATTELPEKR